MPRAIDADALTSVLEKWEEQACDGTENDGSDGTTRVLHPVPTTTREMIDLIADQPTIDPAPQWIPVTERLPEEKGWYWVYAPSYCGGSSSGLCHINGIMFAKWNGKNWSIEVGYHKRPGCVTHWMPLPQAPEDGGAENA